MRFVLGGVGTILTLIGSVMVDLRGSSSPSPAGDSTIKVMCPCAIPSHCLASLETPMIKANFNLTTY